MEKVTQVGYFNCGLEYYIYFTSQGQKYKSPSTLIIIIVLTNLFSKVMETKADFKNPKKWRSLQKISNSVWHKL